MSQPWLFSRNLDLAAFGGSLLAALALVALGAWAGLLQAPMPAGLWLALVVGVDVAHVHGTWLRTYLDPKELRRHPWRYALVPALAYLAGVVLHAQSSMLFWRCLAYLAVFHFVRQQYGWVAQYARREASWRALDRWLDTLTIYAATLWPLLWWHGHLPRRFSWFMAGDFLGPVSARLATWAAPFYGALLGAWVLRQLWRWRREGFLPAGKALVLLGTALSWWLSIVALDSDLAFTALNVLPHGVPYLVLVWRRTAAEAPRSGAAGSLMKAGAAAFLLLVLALAVGEEWLWDKGIWHDHPEFFGAGWRLSFLAQALLVPLLALPQAAHYALDGFIWRSGERR